MENRFSLFLVGILFLLVSSWHSRLTASELAQIPLTEATPESQNLDSRQLNAALSKIDNGDYGDIDALLVVRNNYLVLEKYFSPEYHGREYQRSVLSVTKTITSALIGIAIEQGKIKSVQTKLLDFFPEYTDIKNLDARKQKITLEDVLTMTAGFQWNELAISYADPQNDFNKMLRSRDWIKHVLDAPMSHSPGEALVYNSGCTLLLSSILQKTTGLTAEEFAIEYLFKPLGIEKYSWSIAANELTNSFTGLALRRLDMARIGALFLHQGRWLKRQLIPLNWIRLSTGKHVDADPDSADSTYGYGYQWWRFQDQDPTVVNLAINDVYFAWGYGGQFIFVIPHLNMVVVSTADIYGADYRRVFDLLRDHIFPAVKD